MVELMLLFLSLLLASMYWQPSFEPGYRSAGSSTQSPISNDVVTIDVDLRNVELGKLRSLDKEYAGTTLGKKIHKVRTERVRDLFNERTARNELKREKENLISQLHGRSIDLEKLSVDSLRSLLD